MSDFLNEIYHWYNLNKRDLPWRQTTDPYKIWISEIILQQTRVMQGTDYYLQFINRFPNVQKLAEAGEDEVLKLWQGLGYYSRARNLHFTAKHIHYKLQGKFPEKYKEILNLKGVGKYTAAAIASISFDLPYPVTDGNVNRLISRYFGIFYPIDKQEGKKEIDKIVSELMPSKNTGFHNQALMEFGALQCIPKSPNCLVCPASQGCFAIQNKQVEFLPFKSKKPKQIHRFFYFFFIESNDFLFLEKRSKNDIWKNLYQFPLYESEKSLNDEEIFKLNETFLPKICSPNIKSISPVVKHILSHQIIFARFISVQSNYSNCLNKSFMKINKNDITKYAVPKLIENFIDNWIKNKK